MTNPDEKVLLIKAKGGMGNRMLCTASGLLYAELAGRVPIVDWSDAAYSDDGRNVFSDYFVAPAVRPLEQLVKTDDVVPVVWRGNLDSPLSSLIQKLDPTKHQSLWIHRKYSIDARRLDYPQQLAVFWHYKHRIHQMKRHLTAANSPFETHAGTKAILRDCLLRRMPIQPAIQAKIDDFQQRNWKGTMVAVHVRCTDLKTDLGAYDRALEKILPGISDPTLFLATDNPAVQERYQQRYGKIVSTPKWYPKDGASLHQNKECPNRFENGIEALVDMYLLGRCQYLIYPGSSTFSWISSILFNGDPANLIDIEKPRLVRRFKGWLRDQLA